MKLHPPEVLAELCVRHAKALGLLHGAMALSIQDTCAAWVEKYANLRDVHGGVFAAGVRQGVLWYLQESQFQLESFQGSDTPMYARPGPNCSVKLSDIGGEIARVRKHPRKPKTGKLLPTAPYPRFTLFGIDFSTHEWRPYVLWEVDFEIQTLARAWLGAVANIDKPSKTIIYHKIDLPTAIMPLTSKHIPPVILTEKENWDEYWQEGSSGGDSDPA